mgnify:CR=1 FL=1
MKNIIVFGNVPLATWVVKRILNSKNLNLLGIVCDKYDKDFFKNHGMQEKSLYSYSKKNKLNILEFDEAYEMALKEKILGISVRYHKLFKESYFKVFQPGIINLHGGELPRYRGANIANYIVLEQNTQAGGTLHFIDKGIDEGDIVEREILNLGTSETAYSVFQKTLFALQIAFDRFLNHIDCQEDKEVKSNTQNFYIEKGEKARTYFKKGIENYRIVEYNKALEWNELDLKARAFYFPGHKGAILKKGERMIELKYLE